MKYTSMPLLILNLSIPLNTVYLGFATGRSDICTIFYYSLLFTIVQVYFGALKFLLLCTEIIDFW